MELQTRRNQPPVTVERVVITLGDTEYRITETIDGNLKINKTDDSSCIIWVRPVTGNEVEIK